MKVELRHVLVPTDFSVPSDAALGHALELCKAFGARLTVLHVVEDVWGPAPTDATYQLPVADFKQLEAAARKRLEQAAEAARKKTIPVETVLRHGTPFLEIVRYAREHDADLIVMGTHGRGMIAHLLLGSEAENVVRHAPCPVLTVRQGQHSFTMP